MVYELTLLALKSFLIFSSDRVSSADVPTADLQHRSSVGSFDVGLIKSTVVYKCASPNLVVYHQGTTWIRDFHQDYWPSLSHPSTFLHRQRSKDLLASHTLLQPISKTLIVSYKTRYFIQITQN